MQLFLSLLPALLTAGAVALAAVLVVSLTSGAQGTAVAKLMGPPPVIRRKVKPDAAEKRAKRESAILQRDVSPHEAFARKMTPPVMLRALEAAYIRAGRPSTWTISRLLVLKAASVVIGPLLVAALAFSGQQAGIVLIFAGLAVLLYFLPDLLLWSQGQKRDEAIADSLSDTLDQMLIAVDAGLGFDQAMLRVSEIGKGPLAEELKRTLQDMQMGLSRRAAFKDLSDRTKVVDVKRFVRAILQADKHGISVADVLRTQAAEMRLKRKQLAKEKAAKVPVKVIFPLLICLMPALMLIVLGPAVLNVVDQLSGLGLF